MVREIPHLAAGHAKDFESREGVDGEEHGASKRGGGGHRRGDQERALDVEEPHHDEQRERDHLAGGQDVVEGGGAPNAEDVDDCQAREHGRDDRDPRRGRLSRQGRTTEILTKRLVT
jgi:hypothetical protein